MKFTRYLGAWQKPVGDFSARLLKVMPKTQLKSYLYEFKVPLTVSETLTTCEACMKYDGLPKQVTSRELMTLKQVFETFRKRSGKVNPELVELETSLVEKAAELKDNVAICILAGDTIRNTDVASEQDKEYAMKLLTDLMKQKMPYAFKVSADISYQSGNSDAALQLYEKALQYSSNSSPKLESECCRSIGHIKMALRDLPSAASYFQKAVDLSPDVGSVSDCYFYLGQLYEQDKEKARYCFEQAASVALVEAFAPLGFLLLNYFNQPNFAIEWFKLGSMAGDDNCKVGLFDSYIRLNDLDSARKILESSDSTRLSELRPDSVRKIQLVPKQDSETSRDLWS